jgi:hypothetical protein
MIKKILISLVFVNILTVGIMAQTVPSPAESYINLEVINPETLTDEVLDTLTDPMSTLSANDTLLISVTMLLEDTNVVSKIHIKLGTTVGGAELLEQTFNYDDINLTSPQSYLREEEMVSIGLGEFINSGIFYCEIILEDSLGNLSEITNCQSDQ